MAYELRISGHPPTRFEDEHAVLEAAATALRSDRNAKIQVIDLATGHPADLGERRNWHEGFRKSLGF